jgi:predicted dehydrogenase
VRVGIVGCGDVSRAHIRALHRITGVEVVAVCDTDQARARRIAGDSEIPLSFGNLSELLSEARPEVVHVLTPPRTHKDLALEAMEAGCHVLVEKPMAIDVGEADAMLAAARRRRVTLSVCHNFLFDPAMTEARALVARGAIGRVVAVDIFWGFFHGWVSRFQEGHWVHDLPGGLLHETAPHPVYLLREFLPDARLVSATACKADGVVPLFRDTLSVFFAATSGPGVVTLSLSAKPYLRFVTLYGTEVSLRVDLASSTLVRLRQARPGSERQSLDHGVQLVSTALRKAVQKRLDRRDRDLAIPHRFFVERFHRCLRDGTEPPVTPEAGRAVVAILDQIWAALDAGRQNAASEHHAQENALGSPA